jgi:hypothetical protein
MDAVAVQVVEVAVGNNTCWEEVSWQGKGGTAGGKGYVSKWVRCDIFLNADP